MITEYTDSTEFLRLIEDKKIRVAAIKKHLDHVMSSQSHCH